MNGQITDFIKHHYCHFNAVALVDASEGYVKHLESGDATALYIPDSRLVMLGMQ
ncbi:MAG TPA: hypothetical protein PLL77_00785 [Pyrinomonadaceae bacterium]|nr:hypothetical protein [Pyrinomonadaceae bacterium]